MRSILLTLTTGDHRRATSPCLDRAVQQVLYCTLESPWLIYSWPTASTRVYCRFFPTPQLSHFHLLEFDGFAPDEVDDQGYQIRAHIEATDVRMLEITVAILDEAGGLDRCCGGQSPAEKMPSIELLATNAILTPESSRKARTCKLLQRSLYTL